MKQNQNVKRIDLSSEHRMTIVLMAHNALKDEYTPII